MHRHDENTEARSQTRALTTLRLSTYSRSHYSDEPNKKKCIQFYLHYRMLHIHKHKNKPNRHMTMPNLRTKP